MRTPIISFLFLTVILVSGALANTTLSVSNSVYIPLTVGRWFDYVVVIMMENHFLNNTYGLSVLPNSWNSNSKTCLGNCTYFNLLANSNGLAENYTIDSIQAGSLGDYIAITSGFGNTNPACNSNPPGSGGCTLLTNQNIVDTLENFGLSWKAYMEGYTLQSGCLNSDQGPPYYYRVSHNPFIYYKDIHDNMARCSNIVNANSHQANQTRASDTSVCWPQPVDDDDLFLKDLNSVTSASNYMFLTPNTADDAHDCNDVSLSNAWMNRVIPQILSSALFMTKKAALFVTFDEPDCTFTAPTSPPCPSSAPQLYTVWASNSNNPTTVPGFKSLNPYTHYSALKTIEDNWNLPHLVPSTDGSPSTQNMQEFLRSNPNP